MRFESVTPRGDEKNNPALSFQGAVALDVLGHINPSNDADFLRTVATRTFEDGIFVCGVPSLECQ